MRVLLLLGGFHGRATCLSTLGLGADILLVCAGRTGSRRGMETRVRSSSVFYSRVTALEITIGYLL